MQCPEEALDDLDEKFTNIRIIPSRLTPRDIRTLQQLQGFLCMRPGQVSSAYEEDSEPLE